MRRQPGLNFVTRFAHRTDQPVFGQDGETEKGQHGAGEQAVLILRVSGPGGQHVEAVHPHGRALLGDAARGFVHRFPLHLA